MEISIQPICGENLLDFLSIFDNRNFKHRDWKDCYCMFYHTNCSSDEFSSRTGEMNKREMMERIQSGKQSGYMGYSSNQCVGWVNAGSVLDFVRIIPDLPKELVREDVFATFCFIIDVEYRGKKVASMMLDQIIENARIKGYKKMLALPYDNETQEVNYRGFSQMYINRGYQLVDQEQNIFVLNLDS